MMAETRRVCDGQINIRALMVLCWSDNCGRS